MWWHYCYIPQILIVCVSLEELPETGIPLACLYLKKFALIPDLIHAAAQRPIVYCALDCKFDFGFPKQYLWWGSTRTRDLGAYWLTPYIQKWSRALHCSVVAHTNFKIWKLARHWRVKNYAASFEVSIKLTCFVCESNKTLGSAWLGNTWAMKCAILTSPALPEFFYKY